MTSIINDAYQKYDVPAVNIELLSFTVSVGQRSLTCFVDRSLRDTDCFFFRNCFNVWDVAHLPHITTAKTEVDRSLAVINQRSQFYNQSTKNPTRCSRALSHRTKPNG